MHSASITDSRTRLASPSQSTSSEDSGSSHSRNTSQSSFVSSLGSGSFGFTSLPTYSNSRFGDAPPLQTCSAFVVPLAPGPLDIEPFSPTLQPAYAAKAFGEPKCPNGMEKRTESGTRRPKSSLHDQIETKHAAPFLLSYLSLSAFINAISYTACFIFCGFQTGNTVTLALALARLVDGPTRGPYLQIGGQQALISLLSFIAGSLVTRIVFDSSLSRLHKYTPQSRGWLAFATLLQAILTALAAIMSEISRQSGIAKMGNFRKLEAGTKMEVEVSWTGGHGLGALAFLSASMGLQGSTATPIGAHLSNTLAVTALWVCTRPPPAPSPFAFNAFTNQHPTPSLPICSQVQLVTEPHLLRRRAHSLRDHRILGLSFFFISAFLGRVCANKIGPSWSIGIAAGVRLVLAVGWLVVPLPKTARKERNRRVQASEKCEGSRWWMGRLRSGSRASTGPATW